MLYFPLVKLLTRSNRENEKVTTLTTVLLGLAKKAPEITINPSGAKRSYEHIVVRAAAFSTFD